MPQQAKETTHKSESTPCADIRAAIDAAFQEAQRNPARALEMAESLQAEAEEAGCPGEAAHALRVRGVAYGSLDNFDAAKPFFEEALHRSRQPGVAATKLEANCLHGLANLAFFQGQFTEGIDLMYQAIQVWRSRGDMIGIAASLSSLGGFLGEIGDYPAGVSALNEALTLQREYGDWHTQLITLINLGQIYHKLGDDLSALKVLREAMHLGMDRGERINLPECLSTMAVVLVRLGDLDEAFRVARQCIEITKDVKRVTSVVTALLALASIYETRGEMLRTEDALQSAIHRVRHSGSQHLHVEVLLAFGEFYARQNNTAIAHQYLKEGLTLAEERGQGDLLARLHQALAELHAHKRNFAEAYTHLQAYHKAEQKLQKEITERLLITQTAQMRVEQAEREKEIHRLRYVEMARLVEEKNALLSQLQEQTARLQRLSHEDSLTGLYNRRYLHQYLLQEMEEASHGKTRLVLAIGDLDDFKQINDQYGHWIGDHVLSQVAQVLQEEVGPTGIAARYGGEEFAIVLPNVGIEHAAALCERIRDRIAAYNWSAISPGLRVTISIGVSELQLTLSAGRYGNGLPSDTVLIAQADHLMYQAKLNGKNLVAAQVGADKMGRDL